MLSESVTQEDLQQARVLQAALGDVMADLAVRIRGGVCRTGRFGDGGFARLLDRNQDRDRTVSVVHYAP